MKKKLEAELISIAHRILKLKNKSEIVQLHQETQKLYEKLTVLRFVEENFSDVKPTIGQSEIEDKIEAAFQTVLEKEAPEALTETAIEATKEPEADEPVAPEAEETVEETVAEEAPEEKANEVVEEETVATSEEESQTEEQAPLETEQEPEPETPGGEIPETETEETFKPAFELSFDAKPEEPVKEEVKSASPQISFDDLLGADYVDPVFVKPEDLAKEKELAANAVIPIGRSYNDNAPVIQINKDNATTLNDRLSKGIIIGLNDRIAFMNHLFANSSEDYNRVLSQLITFDTFEEAQNFIETIVKPDYNNWEGKEEYATRFMEIVEKKFS